MNAPLKPLAGKCLCGACSFEATPEALEAGVCHCEMCRKWSGGMFIGVSCGNTVAFDAAAPVASFDSSDWGQRLFCSKCGTTLLWQAKDGAMKIVSMHAFEAPEAFEITHEIFIDSKPANYALANQTKKMTGAEVMAMFASPAEGA